MAAFQQNSAPVAVPASPMYLHSSGVAQEASHDTAPQNAFPTHLEAINSPSDAQEYQQITPYPGYIPPPPPSPPEETRRHAEFPTLIGNSEEDLFQGNGIIGQQGSRTLNSRTPIEILPSSKELSCSGELTTFQSFITCVKNMARLTADDEMTNCTFDQESSCRLHSKSLEWMIGSFANSDHYRTFATLASRPEQFHPSANFAYFVEENGLRAEDEVSLMTSINCQNGNGVLKFDYWIIGDPEAVTLRVCTQDITTRSCTQSIAYGGQSSISVEVVHPNSSVFDLEIVASNMVSPTILAFDNIEYMADICQKKGTEEEPMNERLSDSVKSFFDEQNDENNGERDDGNDVSTEDKLLSIPSRPSVKIVKKNLNEPEEEELAELDMEGEENIAEMKKLCRLLDCDFDMSLCEYSNYKNTSMILGSWKTGNQKIGNPHTGIRDAEGGFMYVGTDSNSSQRILNYILESKELTIDHDFQLSLDIYRRSNDITFQVCLDTPFYCPYSIPSFEKEIFWQHDQVFLIPKGTKKIFLRAIQWRKFKWLAISKLKVVTDVC